jgi:hypothetical protein
LTCTWRKNSPAHSRLWVVMMFILTSR